MVSARGKGLTFLIRPAQFDVSTHTYKCPDSGLVVPSVSQVLKNVGIIDYNGVKESVLDFKRVLGSEVHFLCAAMDRGDSLADFEFDQRLKPYIDSYREFKVVKKWEPTAIEFGPYISDIGAMPVGFTLDRRGFLDGQDSVCELKCTTNDEPSHALQLAAYDMCLGEGRRRLRFSLRLQPDGKLAKMTPYKEMSDYSVFMCALTLTHWKNNKGITNGQRHAD